MMFGFVPSLIVGIKADISTPCRLKDGEDLQLEIYSPRRAGTSANRHLQEGGRSTSAVRHGKGPSWSCKEGCQAGAQGG